MIDAGLVNVWSKPPVGRPESEWQPLKLILDRSRIAFKLNLMLFEKTFNYKFANRHGEEISKWMKALDRFIRLKRKIQK